jgi:hypothetical protein
MYKALADAVYVRRMVASSDVSMTDLRQQHGSMTAYGSVSKKRTCPECRHRSPQVKVVKVKLLTHPPQELH